MSSTGPSEPTLLGGAPPPNSPFPVLLLRSGSLFPGARQQFGIGRAHSLALISRAHVGDVIGVVSQVDPRVEEPKLHQVHTFGAFARVVEVVRLADNAYRVGLEGLGRLTLEELVVEGGYHRGTGAVVPDESTNTEEVRLLVDALRTSIDDVREQGIISGDVPSLTLGPGELADAVAASLELTAAQAAELLSLGNVAERLKRVLALLGEAVTTAQLKRDIAKDVQSHFGKQQREAILRQQLRSIQRQLGEEEGDDVDSKLKEQLRGKKFPPEAQEVVDRELRRLANAQGTEANMIRNYLEWFAYLPWTEQAEVRDDLEAIERKLNEDHSGLESVKARILEHMAVQKLVGQTRGTILMFHGPPGVGKTSLGQSIADATGRPFVRVALGGVRDQAEIRGHRRTYVGSIPGRILHGLRKAGVRNPVVMLDEIDKMSSAWDGSPEAALLEVLDPEQNRHFVDHYLETPFDLSEVMFIATANTLETLSPPLRDRLEAVEITGYTPQEKHDIARAHLIPKRLKEAGVPESALQITDDALQRVIREHTREAGVRQLERELGRITRQAALKVARNSSTEPLELRVDAADVPDYLGKARYRDEVAERTALAGVATGLAWTPVGGEILFVETTRMPGKGRLEITGKLGDVMKESARAALSYLRSHAAELDVPVELLDQSDLHLHVPAGAIPKDGPSAGVTIFTALASLLSGRTVRPDTAMTGEVTLRGRVLPVGGIKSKVLAAHRAGIRRLILPVQNQPDYDEVPESVVGEMEVVWASDMSDVLAAALGEATNPLGQGSLTADVPLSPNAGTPETQH